MKAAMLQGRRLMVKHKAAYPTRSLPSVQRLVIAARWKGCASNRNDQATESWVLGETALPADLE